jgi:hypothetical protein
MKNIIIIFKKTVFAFRSLDDDGDEQVILYIY